MQRQLVDAVETMHRHRKSDCIPPEKVCHKANPCQLRTSALLDGLARKSRLLIEAAVSYSCALLCNLRPKETAIVNQDDMDAISTLRAILPIGILANFAVKSGFGMWHVEAQTTLKPCLID